jgi:glycerate dehydrogenase
MANEVVEYSGLTPKQIMEKLAIEQGTDPGAVCFTALALEQITERELNARLAGADAIVSCWTNIPDSVLLNNPQIKYVGFWTNLVQHRINLKLAKEMGIHVTYIPDYGTIAVAEYTFALLLELMRSVARQASDTASGKWPYELLKTSLYVPSIDAIPYHTLCGKSLGIIGFGRIGQQVAQIALGFGMKVSYYSKSCKTDWKNRGVEFKNLDEVLKTSDIVSIHLSPYANVDPLGRVSIDDHAPDCPEQGPKIEDIPIISKKKLALLKDGALLINTSAGRLLEEDALFEEVLSGRIRVAIDVYRNNPNKKHIQAVISRHGKDRNIFTYRGGWLTYESVLKKGDSLIEQAGKFLHEIQ